MNGKSMTDTMNDLYKNKQSAEASKKPPQTPTSSEKTSFAIDTKGDNKLLGCVSVIVVAGCLILPEPLFWKKAIINKMPRVVSAHLTYIPIDSSIIPFPTSLSSLPSLLQKGPCHPKSQVASARPTPQTTFMASSQVKKSQKR